MDDEITISEKDLPAPRQAPDQVAADVVIEMEDLPPAPEVLSLDVQVITCTYCHTPIEFDTAGVECDTCQAPYHKACWDYCGRCVVLKCTSRKAVILA